MAKRMLREEARRLRHEEGRSIGDIALVLNVSKSTVSTWVRDIELTKEQIDALKMNQHRYGAQNRGARANHARAKSKRERHQQTGREQARKGSLLHAIGCMLYWAEGAKRRNTLYFVNSDPHMLLLFMRFLREEMQIDDDVCRVFIHCHTQDVDEIRRIEQYWLNLLGLSPSCLRKTQVKQGSKTRKNILENGVCGIGINNTELTHQIYGAIQEYGGFENPDWLF